VNVSSATDNESCPSSPLEGERPRRHTLADQSEKDRPVIEKSVVADEDPDAQYPPGTILGKVLSLAGDAFLLDVDGTILDIAVSPEDVRVPSSLRRTLALLIARSGGGVALVSGREIAALDRLFGPLALAVVGCHGAEWRPEPGGPVVARAQPLSDDIRRSLLNLAAAEPRIRVEDKRYTIAFHYRHAPDRGAALEERLRQYLAPYSGELRLLRGKSVVEIKSPSFDKGEAIEALMRLPAFVGRRPVFFGDDTTDEDAFAAVRELHGVGISVGRNMPDAELMVPTPKAVRLSLARLVGCDAERVE
jgi:trehalose 6-phosphate phosphatase